MFRFSSEVWLWGLFLFFCAVMLYVMGSYYKFNFYFLLIAVIPVVRFIVLSGHAASHCMFTYHALWASVTALCLLVLSPVKCFLFDKLV